MCSYGNKNNKLPQRIIHTCDGRAYLIDNNIPLSKERSLSGKSIYCDTYDLVYDTNGVLKGSKPGKIVSIEKKQQTDCNYLSRAPLIKKGNERFTNSGTKVDSAEVKGYKQLQLGDGRILTPFTTPSGTMLFHDKPTGILYFCDGTPTAVISKNFIETQTVNIQKEAAESQANSNETRNRVCQYKNFEINPNQKQGAIHKDRLVVTHTKEINDGHLIQEDSTEEFNITKINQLQENQSSCHCNSKSEINSSSSNKLKESQSSGSCDCNTEQESDNTKKNKSNNSQLDNCDCNDEVTKKQKSKKSTKQNKKSPNRNSKKNQKSKNNETDDCKCIDQPKFLQTQDPKKSGSAKKKSSKEQMTGCKSSQKIDQKHNKPNKTKPNQKNECKNMEKTAAKKQPNTGCYSCCRKKKDSEVSIYEKKVCLAECAPCYMAFEENQAEQQNDQTCCAKMPQTCDDSTCQKKNNDKRHNTSNKNFQSDKKGNSLCNVCVNPEYEPKPQKNDCSCLNTNDDFKCGCSCMKNNLQDQSSTKSQNIKKSKKCCSCNDENAQDSKLNNLENFQNGCSCNTDQDKNSPKDNSKCGCSCMKNNIQDQSSTKSQNIKKSKKCCSCNDEDTQDSNPQIGCSCNTESVQDKNPPKDNLKCGCTCNNTDIQDESLSQQQKTKKFRNCCSCIKESVPDKRAQRSEKPENSCSCNKKGVQDEHLSKTQRSEKLKCACSCMKSVPNKNQSKTRRSEKQKTYCYCSKKSDENSSKLQRSEKLKCACSCTRNVAQDKSLSDLEYAVNLSSSPNSANLCKCVSVQTSEPTQRSSASDSPQKQIESPIVVYYHYIPPPYCCGNPCFHTATSIQANNFSAENGKPKQIEPNYQTNCTHFQNNNTLCNCSYRSTYSRDYVDPNVEVSPKAALSNVSVK